MIKTKRQIQVILGICVLLLFLSAHFLVILTHILENTDFLWMGITVNLFLMIDICIYLGIILQIILILSLIPR